MRKFTEHINESIKVGMNNYNSRKNDSENYWIDSIDVIYRKYCNYSLEMLLYTLESLSKGREVEYKIGELEYKYRIKEIFIKIRSRGPGEGIDHRVFFVGKDNIEHEIPQGIKLEFDIIEKKRIYSSEDPLGEEDWDD